METLEQPNFEAHKFSPSKCLHISVLKTIAVTVTEGNHKNSFTLVSTKFYTSSVALKFGIFTKCW